MASKYCSWYLRARESASEGAAPVMAELYWQYYQYYGKFAELNLSYSFKDEQAEACKAW